MIEPVIFKNIMSKLMQRVLIYGGGGALGSKCVTHFKANGWWVGSIDLTANHEADFNVVVTDANTLQAQEEQVLNALIWELRDIKVDAIICAAGGWIAGNSKQELAEVTDLMWKQNVWTSVIAASISAKYLKEDGLLALSGATVALTGTPDMIGYGLSKAAVHHLTKSVAGNNARLHVELGNGFPPQAVCVGILPTILETPVNREWMSKTLTSAWTPMEFVVGLLWKWCNKEDRPPNGSLLQMITKDHNTDIIPAQNFKLQITRKKLVVDKDKGTAPTN